MQVKRHELKYYISYVDYIYCRLLLTKFMELDPYQKTDNGYFIRSLYFDDIYESSVEDKLAGVEKRDKYRLRIYEFNQDWAKLERKRKHGDHVNKTTVIVSADEAEKIIKGQYDFLRDSSDKKRNSFYYGFKQKYFRPVVIVDYVRDSFVMDFNNIRVTFDKNLRFNDSNLDLYNSHLPTYPIQSSGVVIMEIKFDKFLPPWFSKILKVKSLTSSAVSKYCNARLKVNEFGY